jgi:hypothetical protein
MAITHELLALSVIVYEPTDADDQETAKTIKFAPVVFIADVVTEVPFVEAA